MQRPIVTISFNILNPNRHWQSSICYHMLAPIPVNQTRKVLLNTYINARMSKSMLILQWRRMGVKPSQFTCPSTVCTAVFQADMKENSKFLYCWHVVKVIHQRQAHKVQKCRFRFHVITSQFNEPRPNHDCILWDIFWSQRHIVWSGGHVALERRLES